MTFLLSDEVAMAIAAGRAVVGLETSVIGQGLPFPRNLECVERMEAAIRGTGATPGWVGLVDGAVRVGLERAELERLAEPGAAVKVARRDVPVAVASGSLGATTVSATIWAAHRAGIGVAVTGGIGGVHPGPRRDVSADLLELGRTPIVLIASGPKSIADPAATAERLDVLRAATARAEARMEEAGVAGKAVTPFLLRALAEETGGSSLEANLVLLEDNARLAAEVALAISAATSGR